MFDYSALFAFVEKNFKVLLIALLVFSFAVRVWRIDTPKGYIFDEVYHALTAKLIARGDPRAYEWWNSPVEPDTAIEWTHPPLGKLFHAAGIKVFGENAFGWRISSVFFGVGVIWLIYLIADEMFHDKTLSLLSAFIFSLDGLSVTQSRIAMNDIHLTFFMLCTFLMYIKFKKAFPEQIVWKKYLILSGIALGLTLASKWSGILILGIMIVDQVFEFLKHKKNGVKLLLVLIFSWIILPVLVYLLTYSQMFYQGKGWEHFKELTMQMWWYHSNLKATHPYQSVPMQWIFNLRPVWQYVNYEIPGKIANIYAQGNTILMWSGLSAIICLIGSAIFHYEVVSVSDKKSNLLMTIQLHNYNDHIRLLIMSYFCLWVPYAFSPRIMFFYHYLPAVPFLSLLLGYSIVWLWKRDKAPAHMATLLVTLIVLNFIIFYPNWTGLPVSTAFQQQWYRLIPTWQ